MRSQAALRKRKPAAGPTCGWITAITSQRNYPCEPSEAASHCATRPTYVTLDHFRDLCSARHWPRRSYKTYVTFSAFIVSMPSVFSFCVCTLLFATTPCWHCLSSLSYIKALFLYLGLTRECALVSGCLLSSPIGMGTSYRNAIFACAMRSFLSLAPRSWRALQMAFAMQGSTFCYHRFRFTHVLPWEKTVCCQFLILENDATAISDFFWRKGLTRNIQCSFSCMNFARLSFFSSQWNTVTELRDQSRVHSSSERVLEIAVFKSR